MISERERIFQEIFLTHDKNLYQYIYRKSGDRTDAEDIMQEAFIVLLFKLDPFLADYPDNTKQIKAYLFRIADNKLLHYWRDHQNLLSSEISTELLPELADPHSLFGKSEFSLPDWLTPADKRLILLVSSGYSLKEIAPQLGLTYGACRMRYSRLKAELKKFFEK